MRAQEGYINTFSAAGTQAIQSTPGKESLRGGVYLVDAVCGTWSTASLQLQKLGPDGSTYFNVGSAITSNSMTSATAPLYLPPGQYQWVLTNNPGAGNVVARVQRVPFE